MIEQRHTKRLRHARDQDFFGARGAQISGRKEISSWMFFIAAALAIVLLACALGRATFQSGSNAWKALGETKDSVVSQ